jgi:hypothetical protein
MRRLLSCGMALVLANACLAENAVPAPSSVRLSRSDFRLIREVDYAGRDLFELAIQAGMYTRKDNEYLPGGERGAVSVGGRTWHGSNGVGLVCYDPTMKRYSLFYLQGQAVPGHHLEILYADEDYLFFAYGYHRDLPAIRPTVELYAIKQRRFARIESISTRGGKFGSSESLPPNSPVSMGWDDRPLAGKDWVTLTDARLFAPIRMVLRDGVFVLSYHSDWKIDACETSLQLAKSDVSGELDKLAVDKPEAGGGK